MFASTVSANGVRASLGMAKNEPMCLQNCSLRQAQRTVIGLASGDGFGGFFPGENLLFAAGKVLDADFLFSCFGGAENRNPGGSD